jgi:hypothetical protein
VSFPHCPIRTLTLTLHWIGFLKEKRLEQKRAAEAVRVHKIKRHPMEISSASTSSRLMCLGSDTYFSPTGKNLCRPTPVVTVPVKRAKQTARMSTGGEY